MPPACPSTCAEVAALWRLAIRRHGLPLGALGLPFAARAAIRLQPRAYTAPVDEPHIIDRLQLRYLAWAEKHFYPRLPPRVRAVVETIDRRWIERHHVGGVIGAVLAAFGASIGFSVGLHAAGVSWPAAILMGVGFAGGLTAAMLSAWMHPERYTLKRLWRIALLMMLGTYAGALGSMLHSAKSAAGQGNLFDALLGALWRATPFQLIAGLMLLLMMWVASATRRTHLQRALASAKLAQERDAAARQVAEARLRLLQAQIQPHFLFNTLAALQHWVDTQDARAPALLRSLTTFLRGSTEMFARESVSLADEAAMARHYLAIMQARLGARLRFEIGIDPACAAQPLPPGLLMTLVENAVGHGIEPALAGGTIRIGARRDGDAFELRVEDDGAGLPAVWQEGIGLANCRERLRHHYGDAARLDVRTGDSGRGTLAIVRIEAADDFGHT